MRCAKFINQRRPIGKLEGERIKNEKKDLFKNRTWLDIKFKVSFLPAKDYIMYISSACDNRKSP